MRVKIEGPLECHVWQGATTDRGYPVMRVGGKVRQVRRVLYERHKRVLLERERIEMSCGTRLCVRVDHMEATLRSVPRSDGPRLPSSARSAP